MNDLGHGTGDTSVGKHSPRMEAKLYKRRWVMLFIFCLYSMSNSFMWIQYSSISDIFMRIYNTDSMLID